MGVYFHKATNKWAARVTVAGKRIMRYAASREEAESILAELQRGKQANTLLPPTEYTFRSWADAWLATETHHYRQSTLRSYRQAIDLICSTGLGSARLHLVDVMTVQRAIAALQAENRGKRRVQQALTVTRTCLERAVDLHLIATNPATKVNMPRWEGRERVYWTIDETRRFIEAAEQSSSRWAALFAFLAVTGLRFSEAIALTRDDFDLATGSVIVNKAIVWAGSKWVLEPPKTKAGRRSVVIPTMALWLTRMAAEATPPPSRVFSTLTGAPPNGAHLREYLLQLCADAGVPQINIHGLRHIAAHLLLEAGATLHQTQQALGHAKPSITADIYGYTKRKPEEAAQLVDALLEKRSSETP